jgi:endonuclease/exonuclease/phosphatase family metal-dependent hydrolase
VRLCSFNVKNLFLDGDAGIARSQYGARPKRRAEIRALARALNSVQPDLVAFQEVGSLAALNSVNELVSDPYPHLAVVPGNSQRGIHLGFASRQPMILTSHADRRLLGSDEQILEDHPDAASAASGAVCSLGLQRDLLRCDLAVAGCRLSVFNTHLKSPNQPRWSRLRADQLRQAESRLIARIVQELEQHDSDLPIVVLGDFNDLWPSDALLPLQDGGLMKVDFAPAAAALRSFWPKSITIDHILVNASAGAWLVPDSAMIHDVKSFRRGSDHCPVSVDLEAPVSSLL